MADISKFSSSKVRVFTYNSASPRQLTDPVSISCYVYDPSNVLLYSNAGPLRDPGFTTGVFNFSLPPMLFLQTTKPEGTYVVTTVSQMADGSMDGDSQIINVS